VCVCLYLRCEKDSIDQETTDNRQQIRRQEVTDKNLGGRGLDFHHVTGVDFAGHRLLDQINR